MERIDRTHGVIHRCNHESVVKHAEPRRELLTRLSRKRQALQSIRITIDSRYLGNHVNQCTVVGQVKSIGGMSYTCTAADIFSPAKRSIVDSEIAYVDKFYQDILSVRRIDAFRSPSGVCGAYGGVPIPVEYQTGGHTTSDLVIFLTAWPTLGRTEIAWAVSCLVGNDGRPVMGQVNIGPARVDSRSLRVTLMHEFFHVFGMSSTDFVNFVNPATGLTRPQSEILLQQTVWGGGPAGKTINKFIMSNARNAARTFFGCSTLDGVEIDDDPSSPGSLSSHWEGRILREELMAPTLDERTRLTSISLGLLQDSGWYGVAVASAAVGDMIWGSGAGCSWLASQCNQASWSGIYAICGPDAVDTCSYNYQHWGPCNVGSWGFVSAAVGALLFWTTVRRRRPFGRR
jgi:hypothetical protein